MYSDWYEFSHLQFSCQLSCSCLFFDCLQELSYFFGWSCPTRSWTTAGAGVSVAKTHHPWKVLVRPWTSLQFTSNLSPLIERWGHSSAYYVGWWGHHFYGYNLAYSLELEFDLFSDCGKAPTCNSCHGFIWIPIWVIHYSMERSSSLLWDGSSLMWIPYQSRSQSQILYRDAFCQRWVCSYVLFLMILRIDCYVVMLWWLGTMDKIRMGLKRDV